MIREARKRKTHVDSLINGLKAAHPLKGRELPPVRETLSQWVDRWQLSNLTQMLTETRSQAKDRGPLPYVILTATGEDVRACTACRNCEDWMTPEMDLNFGEILRAAGRDDPLALSNRSLWNCDDAFTYTMFCQEGLDIPAIIRTLRQEARLRGMHIRFYELRALRSRLSGIPSWRPSRPSWTPPNLEIERLRTVRKKLGNIRNSKS